MLMTLPGADLHANQLRCNVTQALSLGDRYSDLLLWYGRNGHLIKCLELSLKSPRISRELAQLAKFLLWEFEDLSSDPRHPYKSWAYLQSWHWEGRVGQIPGAH